MKNNNKTTQQGKLFSFDVLVIGSGISGLMYALELIALKPKCKIALICKKSLPLTNSYFARSGVAISTNPPDTIKQHIADTIKAGEDLADQKSVKEIIENSASIIDKLKQYDIRFGNSLYKGGGHSYPRLHHIKDQFGQKAILKLINQIYQKPQITIFQWHTAIDLIPAATDAYASGAYVFDERNNLVHTFTAKLVVLANGGAGSLYSHSTNISASTGDGFAMAHRAGIKIRNMEFYQFHPTVLYDIKTNSILIPEALRALGAYLLNSNDKKRFMQKYDPKNKEISRRNIVVQAIIKEMEKSNKPFVYLDIRHLDEKTLKNKFSYLLNILKNFGINYKQDLIPVAPAAHYSIGGVIAKPNGQTNIKNLLAIGEIANTNFHGATRLAGNALLECIVMALLAAQNSLPILCNKKFNQNKIKKWKAGRKSIFKHTKEIKLHRKNLCEEMFTFAGIIRNEKNLQVLLKLINIREEIINHYWESYQISRELIELRNMILVAKLITQSALLRKESRGEHYREDYPQKLSAAKNTIV